MVNFGYYDVYIQSDVTAARVARQEGHASLSDELQKGKSKTRIRTQNPFQYISVSPSIHSSSRSTSCFSSFDTHTFRGKLKQQVISFLHQA